MILSNSVVVRGFDQTHNQGRDSLELFCGIKYIRSDRVRGRARPGLQLVNAAQTYSLRWHALDESRKQFEIESAVQSSYGQSAEVATLVDIVCTMLKTGSSCELVEIHLWRCVHRSGALLEKMRGMLWLIPGCRDRVHLPRMFLFEQDGYIRISCIGRIYN